ncbi:MAG: RIO1 family regulatory kinase/ATPase [Candidatus Bathyarchaeia archaeon]
MNYEGLMVSAERLLDEPFASILCYPKPNRLDLVKRVKELKKLGVKALEFTGEKHVLNMRVLGKGCVGIVVKAYRNGEAVALKIRRIDADRSMMQHEADMLKTANQVGVGPDFLGVSRNLLLMQFIDGVLLPEWLKKFRGEKSFKKVLKELLEQCWRLDMAGLDHGELSRAPKHVIITCEDKPFIVDFESASLNRKPSNVTSIAQFLFISGGVSEEITEKLGCKDKTKVMEALRQYKADRNRQNFEKLLKTCEL